MRCLYREKKYICGDFLEVNIFPVFKTATGGRKGKAKPSNAAQKQLNSYNSTKRLIRLLNTNFCDEDIKCELTYSPQHHPETPQQAAKDLQNFLRRLKRFRAKQGLPELKYISATEQGSKSGRLHHHIVINGGILPKDLAKIWGKGYVNKIQPLQFDECGITGIARYFGGNKKQEITEPLFYRRYNSSKNLIKPTERQNDSRISARKAKELTNDPGNREIFEKLYPGYFFADCKQMFNDINTGYYLTVRLYSKTARLM